MTATAAFAAASSTSPIAPYSIQRRSPGPLRIAGAQALGVRAFPERLALRLVPAQVSRGRVALEIFQAREGGRLARFGIHAAMLRE